MYFDNFLITHRLIYVKTFIKFSSILTKPKKIILTFIKKIEHLKYL